MFDQIVSLGSFCEPAWQMDRALPGREHHFFDWLVTPYHALLQVIEQDFAGVFLRENLRLEQDGHTVMDSANGILFHHAFSRDDEGRISQATIDAEYAQARAKVDHLIGKWRKLVASEAHVAHVRLDGGDAGHIAAVRDLLRRRYPGHRFTLVWVQREFPDGGAAVEGAIRCLAAAPPPGPDDWAGVDAEWDRIFARLRSA